MKTTVLTILLSSCTVILFSQNEFDDLSKRDSIRDQHQRTIYYLIQESWLANKEPSYQSIMPFTPSIGEI